MLRILVIAVVLALSSAARAEDWSAYIDNTPRASSASKKPAAQAAKSRPVKAAAAKPQPKARAKPRRK